ncbi:FAS1-like dehydratase domain-containing protein [Glaciimonas immobilis]|uniref:3-methylfumaryl-CoA hydratase n=1 Tax=Glaciimonas immobilis TaxID=728004 RepID=A0A840RW36_9BURK|nr:MaoC family dehydratase N-terminal domain-containing protein [Glaciimonas immobilis]KAF3996546.1 acyl-CoA dehydrogenase [Glaciimonas immobilis]MBB5201086.1 3-methylfumaryl-CoA hydratase [Glaciimonas immobilis]
MKNKTLNLQEWVGRSETVTDIISPTPVAALSATLDLGIDRPQSGTPLPALWHWLYFLPLHAQSLLGADGHAQKGGFMPPVTQPRRMWAGSQLKFHSPICVGDAVERVSTIAEVREKDGRSGRLTFVKVQHQLFCNGATDAALTEFHDIVYRDPPVIGQAAVQPEKARTDPEWTLRITPSETFLFRYSALTFNTHRIHYDRKYATEVEGYPGLVVHGPLIATLLIALVRREMPDRVIMHFEFRAIRPTFDLHPFSVHGAPTGDGKTVHLWAQDHEGFLTLDATVTLA